MICATAYLELFIRRITEPKFLALFLRFLFTEVHDNDKPIIDLIVNRLTLQSQLSTVTLSLLETLIGLNCEDVMLWLIFRHLIGQTAFLPSQRAIIRHPDLHGRAAEKLLQMTPICCLEAKTISSIGGSSLNNVSNTSSSSSTSLPTFLVGLSRPSAEEGLAIDQAAEAMPDTASEAVDYQSYLMDARKAVRDRFEATRCWQYDYDGLCPPPPGSNNPNAEQCCDSRLSDDCSTPFGSAPVSLLTEEEDKEFWNLIKSAEEQVKLMNSKKPIKFNDNLSLSSSYSSSHDDLFSSPRNHNELRSEDIDHSVCSLGTFLDLLLEKVELMPTNSLATNLLVTSLLSQLASYPQPLLRAVLLHPDIILQPSVRGLYTAIASLRQKLDNIMPTFPGTILMPDFICLKTLKKRQAGN